MNQYLLPFFSLFIAFADSIHEARRLNCHYIGVLEEERGQKKEEKKAAREWYHSDVDIDGEGR
uniref:Uncharacterized protein n=1 Tax=Onchocerca volvulus TaxID=6282 RepID=A0A8R1TVT1_ONCVO